MKVINNFTHMKGFHCGFTTLANVANYHGHRLSESMCFGHGEGPDFYYIKDQMSPSRAFNGRNPSMEKLFFKNIGLGFDWRQGKNTKNCLVLKHRDYTWCLFCLVMTLPQSRSILYNLQYIFPMQGNWFKAVEE